MVLVIVGSVAVHWLVRSISPRLYRRLDPATAGTLGFLIRLIAMTAVVLVALRIAGVTAATLALGGTITAVVLGLAAQQSLGGIFAGILLSTRPFRVGERVRLVGGVLAGSIEGTVSSLALFYTTLAQGADRIQIPNSMMINLAVVPLRERDKVNLRARFSVEASARLIEQRLLETVDTPTRYAPSVALEEVDEDSVVLRINATPFAIGRRLPARRGSAAGAAANVCDRQWFDRAGLIVEPDIEFSHGRDQGGVSREVHDGMLTLRVSIDAQAQTLALAANSTWPTPRRWPASWKTSKPTPAVSQSRSTCGSSSSSTRPASPSSSPRIVRANADGENRLLLHPQPGDRRTAGHGRHRLGERAALRRLADGGGEARYRLLGIGKDLTAHDAAVPHLPDPGDGTSRMPSSRLRA